MYRLMISQKLALEHPVSGLLSSNRHAEVDHFRHFSAPLDACESANQIGEPHYYLLNDSGQEYYDGSWID